MTSLGGNKRVALTFRRQHSHSGFLAARSFDRIALDIGVFFCNSVPRGCSEEAPVPCEPTAATTELMSVPELVEVTGMVDVK